MSLENSVVFLVARGVFKLRTMLLHFLEFDCIQFHLVLFAPYREQYTIIKGYVSAFHKLINLWDNNLLSHGQQKVEHVIPFFSTACTGTPPRVGQWRVALRPVCVDRAFSTN